MDLNQVAAEFQLPRHHQLGALARRREVAAAPDQRSHRRSTLERNAVSEKEYYDKQTVSAAPVQFIGIFVSVIMGVGSGFAAVNTMYAAVFV